MAHLRFELSTHLTPLQGIVGFDIETHPRLDLAELPEREQGKIRRRALLDAAREAGDGASESDVDSRIAKELALHPLLNRIVAIAFYQHATSTEVAIVAATGDNLRAPAFAGTESDCLAAFWQVAAQAKTLVGFNSRRFDIPVLYTRSLLLDVPATVDFFGRGASGDSGCRHVDLIERLRSTFTGDRLVSLELACFAFGVAVKTAGHGSDVADLVAQRRFADLANYNLEDARATALLYNRLYSLALDV